MKSIINFLYEVAMLKKTPRSGYQFLGSGRESVAEHTFLTTMIGYSLSLDQKDADPYRTLLLCLVHDLHEARTGDMNYVNKRYVQVDEEGAIHDLVSDLPFGPELAGLAGEFMKGETPEARLAKDADQLALILELKEQMDLGNKYAAEWIHFAVQRLQSTAAKDMAAAMVETDHTEWWFEKRRELWVNSDSGDQNGDDEV